MIHPEVGTSARDILVVDDKVANLRLLSEMLLERGFKVRAVTSGVRALAAIHSSPPDLVLLDIKMPGMSGFEVCEELKADAQTKEIPVIFISALDEVGDKLNAFHVGGVDYITKPFQLEEVLARVETHLALRALQKDLQKANRRLARELALAGGVQRSLLPKELPTIPGWQFSVLLRPARQMSGDFYDICRLPDGYIGLAIGDVVDKGAGAALYMALSCTLLRTYVPDYPAEPARVLERVNERLLTDTDASDFVTLFYGVLDPATGNLTYCNAGHMPPYLLRAQNDGAVEPLLRTGIPLGIYGDRAWEQASIRLSPGDALVLYTDGVTDAQDRQGQFFGVERLQTTLQESIGRPAVAIQENIVEAVDTLVNDAPQKDDIALMVLARDGV